MEFADVVRARRMCREYDPDRGVPDDTLDRLLALSGRAPSAGFTQGRDVVVLRERRSVDAFWEVSTRDRPTVDSWLRGMRTAPVLLLWLSDPGRYLDRYGLPDKGGVRPDISDWPVPFWDVDAGMAAMIALLAAEDAGLGSCFFGIAAGSQTAVRERFGIPDHLRLVGVSSLGHPPPASTVSTPPGPGAPQDLTPGRTRNPYRPRKRSVPDFAHAERFGTGWPGPGAGGEN